MANGNESCTLSRKKFPEGATRRLWESQYSNKTKSCPPNFHCLTHWNIKQHFAAAVVQKRTLMEGQNVGFPERGNKTGNTKKTHNLGALRMKKVSVPLSKERNREQGNFLHPLASEIKKDK